MGRFAQQPHASISGFPPSTPQSPSPGSLGRSGGAGASARCGAGVDMRLPVPGLEHRGPGGGREGGTQEAAGHRSGIARQAVQSLTVLLNAAKYCVDLVARRAGNISSRSRGEARGAQRVPDCSGAERCLWEVRALRGPYPRIWAESHGQQGDRQMTGRVSGVRIPCAARDRSRGPGAQRDKGSSSCIR